MLNLRPYLTAGTALAVPIISIDEIFLDGEVAAAPVPPPPWPPLPTSPPPPLASASSPSAPHPSPPPPPPPSSLQSSVDVTCDTRDIHVRTVIDAVLVASVRGPLSATASIDPPPMPSALFFAAAALTTASILVGLATVRSCMLEARLRRLMRRPNSPGLHLPPASPLPSPPSRPSPAPRSSLAFRPSALSPLPPRGDEAFLPPLYSPAAHCTTGAEPPQITLPPGMTTPARSPWTGTVACSPVVAARPEPHTATVSRPQSLPCAIQPQPPAKASHENAVGASDPGAQAPKSETPPLQDLSEQRRLSLRSLFWQRRGLPPSLGLPTGHVSSQVYYSAIDPTSCILRPVP